MFIVKLIQSRYMLGKEVEYGEGNSFSNCSCYRYDDPGLALHYGAMLRECIRHQVVARLATLETLPVS